MVIQGYEDGERGRSLSQAPVAYFLFYYYRGQKLRTCLGGGSCFPAPFQWEIDALTTGSNDFSNEASIGRLGSQ